MKAIQPKSGYDFGNKRQYRRDVWGLYNRFINSMRSKSDILSKGEILLMPGPTGEELNILINKYKVSPRLIHIVDHNPAIVAVHSRKYPGVNAYGVSIDRALDRMLNKGTKLAFASFDFCSNVSLDVFHTMKKAASLDIWREGLSVITVTLMGGREVDIFPALKFFGALNNQDKFGVPWKQVVYRGSLLETDYARLDLALAGFFGYSSKVAALGCAKYLSGKLPMIWGAMVCQWNKPRVDLVRSPEFHWIGK